MKYSEALDIIEVEYQKATSKFGKFNSAHEGYAVLKEELDELWDDIKSNKHPESLAHEAKQVAAMALRFLVDCCEYPYIRGDE